MRRLILLISVGWVPPYWLPSGACLSLGSSVLDKPPHAAEGYTKPGLRLFRCTWENLAQLNRSQGCVTSGVVWVLHGDGPLLGNGPQEASQFAGNGDRDHSGMFASCDEASIAFTEPHLRFPTDVLDDFRLFCES
jgi:hypothetical protein